MIYSSVLQNQSISQTRLFFCLRKVCRFAPICSVWFVELSSLECKVQDLEQCGQSFLLCPVQYSTFHCVVVLILAAYEKRDSTTLESVNAALLFGVHKE
jgi:hypothetical protein